MNVLVNCFMKYATLNKIYLLYKLNFFVSVWMHGLLNKSYTYKSAYIHVLYIYMYMVGLFLYKKERWTKRVKYL